jgi:ethanolamine transporter
MGINEIIMYIMMFFMLIAAVDRILSQFGGSARFLGKLGKSIEGSGGQFEEGFMAMGALGLAMVGMTALAPVLAHLLGPVIIPLYEMLGANPSMSPARCWRATWAVSSSPKNWRAATWRPGCTQA